MIAFFVLLLLTPAPSTLVGNWVTPDASVVQVFSCGNEQLCTRLIKIGIKDAPKTDVSNPDASLRTRPLCGLTIGTAFTPDGTDQAKDGKIYDPESGKTYSAQMQAQGDQLKLRGYIGVSLLGRTETWHRASGAVTACQ